MQDHVLVNLLGPDDIMDMAKHYDIDPMTGNVIG